MTFEQALNRYYEETYGEHAPSTGKDLLSAINDILEKNNQPRQTEAGEAIFELLNNLGGASPEPEPTPIGDGNTHYWITIPEEYPENRRTVLLRISNAIQNETVSGTIEWGDGEETSYSASSLTEYTHSYASAGNYIITIIVNDGKLLVRGNATTPHSPAVLGLPNNKALLTRAEIPTGVVIGDKAFTSCGNLTSLVLPEDCVEIPMRLANYTKITDIKIPNGVTSIGDNAFESDFLTHLSIPDGVISIGSYIINETNIASLTIPSGLTTLGRAAFGGYVLNEIHMKPVVPPTASSSIFSAYGGVPNKYLTIFVPAESVNAYKTASIWSTYADYIFAEPEVTS